MMGVQKTNVGKMELGLTEKAEVAAARDILEKILGGYQGSVAVRLWNGEWIRGGAGASCRVILHQPAVLRDLMLHRNLMCLAESYLAGEIDLEGDTERLFDLTPHLRKLNFSWSEKWRMMLRALHLPRREVHSGASADHAGGGRRHSNNKESIAHHYDVSNEFYRLWLDAEMVYSCAYFHDTEHSLAQAQLDKLDYICRKLRLEPGQKLLDIGCGWGALAFWAARHYGVEVHGITLSEQQHDYALKRARNEGLEDRVRIELRDYRDLPERACYDRVVSVGMFEHIGISNFPLYFGTIKRVLKPSGLFLNHGITNDTGWRDTQITRFMNRYVFPDGELARISDVEDAMEQAGFEIIDVEGLRRHYAMTLRHWVRALEERKQQAVDLVGEASYRVWRLYMVGCAYFFDEGSINVYQVLTAPAHQSLATPLRRDDIYKKYYKGKTCEYDDSKESSNDR
ncbi:MAG: cyclopropane-fatty-acyl-phospholipid synthase family protein [Gammaproteobacteria bacterium]|nr:cyclopropane-fatty-acyl-phospholipid synthase family protein [Gammaproteobacteria bacterium]